MKGQRVKGGGGGFKESSLNYIFCKFLFVAILKFVQIPTTLCLIYEAQCLITTNGDV